jgi:three-Cys-motif partner protein
MERVAVTTPPKRSPSPRETLPLFPTLESPPSFSGPVTVRNLKYPVWTEQKAKLIARYLRLFTYVTKHGTYIDGFAGPQSAMAASGWAAELVLANTPRWLRRFYLCDSDPDQISALRTLIDGQPPKAKGDPQREIEAIRGDFNSVVGDILATRKLDPATFCLLDQRTFECRWSTVTTLANFRPSGKRIELFYFLPIGWINRAIIATTRNHSIVHDWWGGEDWEPFLDLKPNEKAAVFQRRFYDLGYRQVNPFPIYDHVNGGRIMFYMILASDHPDAPKLMWRAYHQGVHDVPGWDQLDLGL